MTSTPNKRKNISLEEKYEIMKDKEKGMSVKDLVDKYKYGAGRHLQRRRNWFTLQSSSN